MSSIRIDAPGAGDWVMDRVDGAFFPGHDHSFTTHDDEGEIQGGFVLCQYLGVSATIHAAGNRPIRWCSRELLWMVFDYAFNQCGCRKLIAPVRSDNHYAMSMYMRAGWDIETVIRNVYPTAHMLVLTMTKDTCRWLDYNPRTWRSGKEPSS